MTIKKQTLIKTILIIVLVFAVLLTSAWFFISYQLSHLDNFKDEITAAASKALQRDFSFEKGQAALTFPAGVNVQFTNIVIREKDKSEDFLIIPTVFFRMNILPLLRNRIILREVALNQPQLFLKRDRSGTLNIADFLTGEKKKQEIELRKITVEKGLITFLDQAAGAKDLITSLTDLSCRLDTPRWSKKSSFHITSIVSEEKNKGNLTLTGTFRYDPQSKPLFESTVDASLRLKGIDINHYYPYLKRIPVKQLAGRLDTETTFSGTLSNFQSKGTITVNDVLLDYPEIFRSPLQPQSVQVNYNLRRNKSELKLDVARLAIDNLTASGHFLIRDMDQADPIFAASAATCTFFLENARPYIPWKIIPRDVGNFIEAHVKDGYFRLVDGKLSGRKSQIAGIEKPENAGVLFIKGEVNKGVFAVNEKTPIFRNISGVLELKNRQFSLKKMKGLFGSSPCTLDGNISDFALPQPNVYNAEMILQPNHEEVLWLVGKKFRNFKFQGNSTLRLFGKGPADNFHVDANWDLTAARYAYPEVMEKPQGKTNLLTCNFVVNKEAFIVSSLHYDLPEIMINGSALYNFAGENPLSFKIISNEFDIRKTLLTLPILKHYDPAGKFQINVAGYGNPSDIKSFNLQGNVSLADVSAKLPKNIKPVKELTGKIIFGGKQIETSQLKARIGKSAVTGKCALDNFNNPQVICQFASSLFHTSDVGLKSPEKPVNFKNMKGQITVSENFIQINKLDLQTGQSRFNLLGNIRDFAKPEIIVSLNSPYMDSKDIYRLSSLKFSQGERKKSFPEINLEAAVQVNAGTFQGADFNNLESRLNFTGETLDVKKFESDFFDGKITGKGKIDFRPDGQNYYLANFSINKISLDKIQNFLKNENQIIRGTLTALGNVTAEGSTIYELEKSARGKFQINAGKGVLERFAVLSKIFSLLNVVQLAKFKLPDMAKGGMPYTKITGDLSLDNGVLSSKNFFIDSDAMQISAAGKVDLLNKELDNIVGVHPLHTLDKIVARIPVAGWLLTDKKGNLITVHFKVDGKWGNPNVTPIPVQSVAQGTLDIFRRLFKLPEKLVTDTGEVILGH
ncbi:MAG: AsmA-like C-terminal domain-containing protein [Smithella sp.]